MNMKKLLSLLCLLLAVVGLSSQEVGQPRKSFWGFELGTHNVVNYTTLLSQRATLRASLGATVISDDYTPSGLVPYLNLEYRHLLGGANEVVQRNGLYAGLRLEGYAFKPAFWWRDVNVDGQYGVMQVGPTVGFIFRTSESLRLYAEVAAMKRFSIADNDSGKVSIQPVSKFRFPIAFGVLYSL